jgi:hypothetical protein
VANFRAVYSVGSSIAQFLQDSYPADLKAHFPCSFRLVSSAEIATEEAHAIDQTVTIFLHRLTLNEQVRSVTRLPDRSTVQPKVFLDLHYLVTYWGSSAEAEQTILSWVMQQLTGRPILDSSILSAAAKWRLDETVQLIPTNLSLEDILRIWDALGPKYRLSTSYLARLVEVDVDVDPAPPVVATRFQLPHPPEPAP